MAAVLGLSDEVVEEVCDSIKDAVVVPANYNCPGQLVISGSIEGIDKACELLKEKGAKRALKLPVGGAFHSPLMQPAGEELQAAIHTTVFSKPICPVYQNVNAYPQTNPEAIKENLIAQLTAPVRWTQTVKNMLQLVKQGYFSMEKVVEKMCHAPARLFKIEDRGFIRTGYYADLVLVDPKSSWTVNSRNILYKCGWSPFEGTVFDHKVVKTIVNGHLVYSDGIFDENFRGKRLLFEY